MYALVNDANLLEVYAEENDVCYLCSNMNECPLLAALQNEIVILHYDGLNIQSCGMFQELSADAVFNEFVSEN